MFKANPLSAFERKKLRRECGSNGFFRRSPRDGYAVYPKQARCGSVKDEADMREAFKFNETLNEDTIENKTRKPGPELLGEENETI